MMMFLSIVMGSVLVLVLCSAIMAASEPGEKPRSELRIAVEPPRFFAGDIAPVSDRATLPVEVVLSQIERHVRLEQAAAERFVNVPTAESLNDPSASPFVN